jgi:hypothetical protein
MLQLAQPLAVRQRSGRLQWHYVWIPIRLKRRWILRIDESCVLPDFESFHLRECEKLITPNLSDRMDRSAEGKRTLNASFGKRET